MKSIFYVSALLGVLAISTTDVVAGDDHDDHHHDEENIRHYEVSMPKSKAAAKELLKESLIKIEKAIEEGNMHAVHEISYNSEAAIKGLKKLTKDSDLAERLHDLWEINEEMHEESESDDVDKAEVREEFEKLKAKWKTLKAKFN